MKKIVRKFTRGVLWKFTQGRTRVFHPQARKSRTRKRNLILVPSADSNYFRNQNGVPINVRLSRVTCNYVAGEKKLEFDKQARFCYRFFSPNLSLVQLTRYVTVLRRWNSHGPHSRDDREWQKNTRRTHRLRLKGSDQGKFPVAVIFFFSTRRTVAIYSMRSPSILRRKSRIKLVYIRRYVRVDARALN